MTEISTCSCFHEVQDSIYGKGKRLFNIATKKGAKPKNFRCTVCKKEKDIR